jgi:hypothetical protein
VIIDAVPQSLQRALEVLFQEKAGVIGSDRDTHKAEIVL